MLRGDCLYDARALRGLVKTRQAVLEAEIDGRSVPVAAHVRADQVAAVAAWLESGSRPAFAADIATVTLDDDREELRSRVEEAGSSLRSPGYRPSGALALERLTFSGAYKGVTDLVTKWLWPVPARWVTRWCVAHGHHPNQVTFASLVLVVIAGVLFARGEFAWGLVAGWIMTFLDTVDGKLARVTVTSTKLGNVFDHGIDLIHPPLWYLAWGMGLALSAARDRGRAAVARLCGHSRRLRRRPPVRRRVPALHRAVLDFHVASVRLLVPADRGAAQSEHDRSSP